MSKPAAPKWIAMACWLAGTLALGFTGWAVGNIAPRANLGVAMLVPIGFVGGAVAFVGALYLQRRTRSWAFLVVALCLPMVTYVGSSRRSRARSVPTRSGSPSERLALAIEEGNASVFEDALSEGALSGWSRSYSPLHLAAEHDRLALARRLIEAGVDASATDEHGMTTLHTAAAHGATRMTGWLLANGASVESRDGTGRTALLFAVCAPSVDAARQLLEASAELGVQDEDGNGVLHHAGLCGEAATALIQLVVEHGAHIDARNGQGRTPLMCTVGVDAFSPRRRRLVEALITAGADRALRDSHGQSARDILVASAIDEPDPAILALLSD